MGTVGEHAAAKEEALRVQGALGLGASIGVIQLICCPRTAPCSSGTLGRCHRPMLATNGWRWQCTLGCRCQMRPPARRCVSRSSELSSRTSLRAHAPPSAVAGQGAGLC